MSLPLKSTRPLKKRRIVRIEQDDSNQSQPSHDNGRNDERKETKLDRKFKRQKRNVDVSPLPSPPSSPATVVKNNVTWDDKNGNSVHQQPDPSQLYPHFNERDLWYTRNNYKEFLLDRLKTIESHRLMATSNLNEHDSDSHCIRGLEPFQDDYTNEHFQSKKKLHHSTIKIEQTRQALLGIKDPERFRELVATQSEIALRRAQELAAQDQKEIYPFRPNSAANSVGVKQLQNDHIPIQNMSTTSSADMTRLRGLMDSIYGGSPNTASFMADSAGASVVSDADVSSTGSNCSSSSSESNNSSQSLFADESIRKLQERSMRRLMGIYQNNNGEGVEGDKETNALFKFARRDSLLGIRNNNSRDSNSTPSTNKVCAVPNEPILSRQEQLLEMLHRQQLQERLQHQQAAEEATPSLEKQLIEMLHRRQQLEEHFQQQQQVSHREIPLHLQKELLEMIHRRNLMQDNGQQQQQQASAMKTAPSLQERLIDMIQHQQQMQGHEQHQQASSTLSAMMQSIGSDNGSINNANSLIEEYLIQQQQHHQEHQNKMKLALMAMNASRFPIRRDTLSHVHMA